jgi:hypothetical protein
MATDDEPTKTEEAQQIKTAADVRLEAIEKEIAAMKEAHAKQVEELLEANRGLYAMLQQSKAEPAAAPKVEQEPVSEPGPDPAIAAMNAALGIKTEVRQ